MSEFKALTQEGNSGRLDENVINSDLSMEMFDPLASDSPIGKPSTPEQNSSITTPELQKSYPSTPPNSMLETSVLDSAVINTKQHNLPSFNSLEMVQRIHQKKAALEVISESYTQEDTTETDTFPFTPSNSLVEGSLMNKDLPSFNSSEMVGKISQKRAAFAATHDHADASESEANQFPFTPPNSFTDSTLHKPEQADLNIDHQDFLHKMFAKKRERNHSDMVIYPRDVESEQLSADLAGNVVALRIYQEMGGNIDDLRDTGGLLEEQMADNIVKEIMKEALDTCDPRELQQILQMDRKQVSTGVEEKTSASSQQQTSPSDIVETEYLSEVDPLQGNIDIVKFPKRQFSTDAEREVAESTSFNLLEEEKLKLDNQPSVQQSSDTGKSAAAAADTQQRVVGRQGVAPTSGKAVNFWVAASVDKGGTGNVGVTNGHSEAGDGCYEAVPPPTDNGAGCNVEGADSNDSVSSVSDSDSSSGESYRITADSDSLHSSTLEPALLDRIEEKDECDSEPLPGSVLLEKLAKELVHRTPAESSESELYTRAEHIVNGVFSSITTADLFPAAQNGPSSEEDERNCPQRHNENWHTSTNVDHVGQSESVIVTTTSCHKPLKESEEKIVTDKIEQGMRNPSAQPGQNTASFHYSNNKGDDSSILNTSLPEDLAMETGLSPLASDDEDIIMKKAERPQTLLERSDPRRKIVPNMDMLKDDETLLSQSSLGSIGSVSMSEDEIMANVENVKTPDDLSTPDALNNSVFDGELTWGDDSPSSPAELIPEYTASDEFKDERNWRNVTIAEKQFRIDMKVIEPYKKVLSHGGYYGDGLNAIVVFCACYLPDRSRRDYHYVMDNLFLYVISTLELLVVEDYMIVYFHGATPRQKMPNLRWLKRCYEMIDRRLRKNLKKLFIVHPTFWLKTIVLMTKPFVSSKFSNKLHYVRSIQEMTRLIPTEYIYIPDEIKAYDARKNKTSPSPPVTPP